MAETKRVLGPGAKGDPDDPGKKISLKGAKATEVVEAVESGVVDREAALAAEQSREDGPRKTVTSKLSEEGSK